MEERILKSFSQEIEQVNYLVRPELEEIWKLKNQAQSAVSFDIPKEGARLILNGRVLLAGEELEKIFSRIGEKSPLIWLSKNSWAAIYLPDGIPPMDISELMGGHIDLSIFPDQIYLNVPVITYPWDLIEHNSTMIRKDFSLLCDRLTGLRYPPLPSQVAIKNEENLIIGRNAEIYPFVTFDCNRGPIIIGDNVTIQSGAFIQGPAVIDDNCLVSANTKIYRNTVLGKTTKAGGEISHSIIHGFSNKRHSGFLGNSYLGEWVNLGAGTNISNMKNNYNKISVIRNGKETDTGTQFLGLFMGDHSRSAIATQFNTATFAGVGCNIFGSGIPEKHIKDFTWGGIDKSDIQDFQKFINNVKRMMIRREKELSKEEESLLKALHECRSIIKNQPKIRANGTP